MAPTLALILQGDAHAAPPLAVTERLHVGAGGAGWAAAFEAVEAEFVVFLRAGDRLEPAFVDEALALLESEGDLAVVSAWFEVAGGGAVRPHRCELPDLLSECVMPAAAVARVRALRAVGGLTTEQDEALLFWDLWVRVLAGGRRAAVVQAVRIRCASDPRAPLSAAFVARHGGLYREHLLPVLLEMERAVGDLQRRGFRAERRLERELHLELSRRVAQRERLRARLAAARTAEARTQELLESASWRVTAPARAAWDLLRRLRRSGS